MKKAISILMFLLFVLTILYPVGVTITACLGYSFELISVSAFAIAAAALSVCIVVLDLICKNTLENNTIGILLAIIATLSLINGWCRMTAVSPNYIFFVHSNSGRSFTRRYLLTGDVIDKDLFLISEKPQKLTSEQLRLAEDLTDACVNYFKGASGRG